MAEQNDADILLEAVELEGPKRKKKRMKKFDEEAKMKLVHAVESEMDDAYSYSSAELYSQMSDAWLRYYRAPYGNENPDYSQWVSPMITKHVNQVTAFLTEQYHRNSAPIVKFRPKTQGDVQAAELADEYINYLFRQKLNGNKIIQETAFNAALLKICPVRVYMKEVMERDTIEFKHDGSAEEMEERLATFFAANPQYMEEDPDVIYEKEEDGEVKVCYRWYTPKVVDRYPTVDVISPGAFFVSRQAECEEDARMVAMLSQVSISEMKLLYPDAPKLNGYTTKKDAEQFWAEMVGDYNEWYREIEWLSRWSYDSLGFNQQEELTNDESAGLGSKKLFVMDAEIFFDQDDTGHSELTRVVKCADKILLKEPIAERSFLWGTLVPQAGRWVGLSLYDLLNQEAVEESINTRAFTDATAEAAHSNPIVDPDVIEMDDVENRGPGTTIRYKRTSVDKGGRPGIEWTKQSGPDQSILTAIQAFQATATQLTGVGANFQGATMDEASDMRMSTETAKIIDNNSSLMLNYFARNYSDFLCRVLVKLLNTAVKGGANKQMLEIRSNWQEVNPMMMESRSEFYLNADIGVNDAQEKANKAQAVLGLLQAASGGGGQGPNGEPIPQIPVQLTPTAGYQAAKLMLEAQGVVDVEAYLVNPEVAQGQVQQVAVQQMIQQQVQAGIQAGVQQAIQQAMQGPEAQKMMAEAAKLQAEAGLTAANTEKVMTDVEKQAFDAAEAIEAESRRNEEDEWKAAAELERIDLEREKVMVNLEVKKQEMALQKEIANRAKEVKANSIINP